MKNRRNNTLSKSKKEFLRLRSGFLRLDQEEFREEQPPKPLLKNAGDKGKTLQKAVAEFRERLRNQRQQLQRQYNAASARRITVRPLKDDIINHILFSKASALSRRELKQLPMGELHAHLRRFDWRNFGIVPPVRDQRECNSCWALAATQAFESNLMIQLANFATNNNDRFPDMFFVSQIAMNFHSTMDCVEPFKCDPGRFEAALNYYFEQGIPANEITLNNVPLDQQGRMEPIPDSEVKRDPELPTGHFQHNHGERLKIIGWDYVRRDAFKIPSKKALKMALLEHGPLMVAINTVGLEDYGNRQLADDSYELGTNPGTGIIFKRETVTGGLLVYVPLKQMEKQFVESLGRESFNLNSPKGGDHRYRFFPAAADTFKQSEHRRAASADLNVGRFHERTLHQLDDMTRGKLFQRETEFFVFHFPRDNDVRLKQDPVTDNFSLHFPVNSETKVERDPSNGKLTMVSPWHESEDLSPVFEANPNLNFNHFVLLIGWDDQRQAWIMQNSWGDDWGFTCGSNRGRGDGKGYAYVRYGTFGQYAAWLEADLLDQKFLSGADVIKTPA